MRFEFLEPTRSLQPNLTSAETSGVIPPLKKKKLVLVHIYFFARKGGLVSCEGRGKKCTVCKKKKKFKDGKNRLERG